MSTPNRYAIREAGEATFVDIATDLPKVTLRTLKMSEVETTGETTYAQGGRGNAKLVGFSSDREARVTLEDAIFDNEALSILTGNKVEQGVKEVQMIYEGTIATEGTIELPHEVENLKAVYIIDTDGISNGELIDEPSFTGKVVTAGSEGDKVRVYYTVITADTSKTIKVTAENFAGTYKLIVDVVVRDEDGKDYYGQFIANRVKVEDEFSFTFSPDGDPSVLNIPMEILRDRQGSMWELVIYDQESIA